LGERHSRKENAAAKPIQISIDIENRHYFNILVRSPLRNEVLSVPRLCQGLTLSFTSKKCTSGLDSEKRRIINFQEIASLVIPNESSENG